MIEIVISIEHLKENDKLEIGLRPRDNEPSLVEKDVFLGLMPHIQSLLQQLLGQEDFRKKQNKEDELVDKTGAPLSHDYMVSNGMIEPDTGPETIDPRTGERR